MNAALSAVAWLIRDTFRQTLASGIFWLMLVLSAVATVLCLTVDVSGDDQQPLLNVPQEDLRQSYAAVADLVTARLGQGAGMPRVSILLISRPYKDVTRKLAEGMSLYQPPVLLSLAGWPILRTAERRQAVHALELA